MILTSHQPNFMPYMGVFYKALRSDILVLSDDVSYSKKGMHNWNRIYTSSGVKKLTLPVCAHHDSSLGEIFVSEPVHNLSRLAKTVEQEYKKAPHYEEGMELIRRMLLHSADPLRMAELNADIIWFVLQMFGIKVKILMASTDLDISGHKDERIFKMCEQTGADVYYSGTGAKVYHEEAEYERRGIDLVYSDYTPVTYEQVHGQFEGNLSVLDYIFNKGFTLPEEWRHHL